MRICIVEPIGILGSEVQAMLPDHEVVEFDSRGMSDADLIERCRGCRVMALTSRPLSASVIDSLPDLGLIAVAFAGVDSVDTAAAESRNVLVRNAQGYANTAVAELALGFMITLARHVVTLNRSIRDGGVAQVGNELRGKTITVIGTGGIGREVMRLSEAFGMKTVPFDRDSRITLLDAISGADFVSLHVPLTPTTRGLFGTDQFTAMKTTAYLVNLARGPIVDAEALDTALGSGSIAGAALDVFDRDPPLPRDYPLLRHDNVIATPHIGFDTVEAVRKKGELTAEHIAEYVRAQHLANGSA
ncbi:MAG: NAD(P)-dependent oxidoreductase [Candidatus Nanopelagicales bacterium]